MADLVTAGIRLVVTRRPLASPASCASVWRSGRHAWRTSACTDISHWCLQIASTSCQYHVSMNGGAAIHSWPPSNRHTPVWCLQAPSPPCQLRIGVDGSYGVAAATTRWRPTFSTFLNEQLQSNLSCNFTMVPYPEPVNLLSAVQAGQLDFVFVNPSLHECLQVWGLCTAQWMFDLTVPFTQFHQVQGHGAMPVC